MRYVLFSVVLFIMTHGSIYAEPAGAKRQAQPQLPQPLPYQAIVVTWTMSNARSEPISEPNLEMSFVLQHLFQPGSKDPLGVFGRTVHRTSGITPLEARLADRLQLKPDEESTVTTSWGECWTSDDRTTPLFPRPGKYKAEIKWALDDRDSIQGELWDVGRPDGEELTVYRILGKDPELGCSMSSARLVPTQESYDRCTRIVENFSKTSYADYARFAKLRFLVRDWSKKKGPSSFTEQGYQQAKTLMAEIDLKCFPYAPQALVLMRKVASRHDLPRAKEFAERLDTLFPDHEARINDLASRLSQEEWDAANPRRAHKIGEGKVPERVCPKTPDP